MVAGLTPASPASRAVGSARPSSSASSTLQREGSAGSAPITAMSGSPGPRSPAPGRSSTRCPSPGTCRRRPSPAASGSSGTPATGGRAGRAALRRVRPEPAVTPARRRPRGRPRGAGGDRGRCLRVARGWGSRRRGGPPSGCCSRPWTRLRDWWEGSAQVPLARRSAPGSCSPPRARRPASRPPTAVAPCVPRPRGRRGARLRHAGRVPRGRLASRAGTVRGVRAPPRPARPAPGSAAPRLTGLDTACPGSYRRGAAGHARTAGLPGRSRASSAAEPDRTTVVVA